MPRHSDFALLEQSYGINLPGAQDYSRNPDGSFTRQAMDAALALPQHMGMDATYPGQSFGITTANAGVPWFLSNFVDPKVIEILVAPMKAAEIIGEVKKGDWTMNSVEFPVVESTGEVSSYGDFSNNGMSQANALFVPRQSYHYQTITEYGERELAMQGLAKLDWVSRLNTSAALNMAKFQNKSYFFGVQGLANYGLLNDPALSAAITPITKTGGGTAWSAASLGTEVYADIQNLVQQLINQTNGLVQLDTAMKLVMSPASQVALTKVTQYNVNVMDMIKKNFPNMTVHVAPEYAASASGLAGDLVQLIVDSIEGQEVADAAFTEKMRAFGIIKDTSSYKQKKAGGTWGAIIYQPMAIAQLIGV